MPTLGGISDKAPLTRSSTARPPPRASSTSAGISTADGTGGSRIATQHMPRARDLKHHRSQPMTHEIMDVTSDPTALLQHRLLGQLTPRGLQRRRQLRLTEHRATDQPRKRD